MDVTAKAIWYERVVPGAQPEPTSKPEPKKEPEQKQQPEQGQQPEQQPERKEPEKTETTGAAPEKVEPNYLSVGETLILNLTSEKGQAKIIAGAETLDSIVAKFKEDKNLVVEITPSVVLDSGSKIKPATLAKQRYDAIVKELTSKGVKKTQLKQGKSVTDTVTTIKVLKSSRKAELLNFTPSKNLARVKISVVVEEQHFTQRGKRRSQRMRS